MNRQPRRNESFKLLFDSMGESLQNSLMVMSAAVSLTDEVAAQLLGECVESVQLRELIIEGTHGFDFVVERNSEWHFESATREFLLGKLYENHELAARTHDLLLGLANEWDGSGIGETFPEYLTWSIGKAYHKALGDPDGALRIYAASYSPHREGDQWLLGQMTGEQQRMRILPANAIEPSFYQGMVAYRERSWSQAEQHLSRLEHSNETRSEVAIGLHILALLRIHGHREAKGAETLLRRSLQMLEALDDRHGQAQVLHTLGSLIQHKTPAEAESMLHRSLELLEAVKDRHGQAMVLHTLGSLIQHRTPAEAASMLRRSLELLEVEKDRHGQAQVLHTLGSLIWRKSPDKAESMLRKSLELLEALDDRHGQAQVLHTLGSLIWRKSPDEAESMLNDSLEILRAVGDRYGEAKVLHTKGRLIHRKDPELAEELLLESLELRDAIGRHKHQAQVLNTLGNLIRSSGDWQRARSYYKQSIERSTHPSELAVAHLGLSHIAELEGDIRAAIAFMEDAVELTRRTRNTRFVRRHERRLSKLRQLLKD